MSASRMISSGFSVLRAPEGDPDARRREHLAAADREGLAQHILDAEGHRVGLRFIGDAVEENGELVAAEPGQHVVGPQAGLEPA